MKFRISAVEHIDGATRQIRDICLITDVRTSVREVARGLSRARIGNPGLLDLAISDLAPLTLKVSFPGMRPLILDSGTPIGESGLRSGCTAEPVLESHPGDGDRLRPPAAVLTVLSGEQEDVTFLVPGEESLIGRAPDCRVYLQQSEVSRRHAILRPTDHGLEIDDLGSVNGTSILDGDAYPDQAVPHRIHIPQSGSALIEIGTTVVRVESAAPSRVDTQLPSTVAHLQSPRVEPSFEPDPLDLPAPPDKPQPSKFPLLAMIFPLLMGAVLYMVTGSMLSLVFIALSPLIMIGSWLDSFISGRRALKTKRREYRENLELASIELAESRRSEQIIRALETPSTADLLNLPSTQESVLWARRAEHRSFLELRLGAATLPSRKVLSLPQRGNIPADEWTELVSLRDQYATVDNVPLTEHLQSCGSLGLAGVEPWLMSAARAIVVQLVALHSPASLVFTAFANEQMATGEWAWLKWLPHTDSVYSPLQTPHLASDSQSSNALLVTLESLIVSRQEHAQTSSIRSHQADHFPGSDNRMAPVDTPPVVPTVAVLVLDPSLVDMTRLVGIAEDGPDVGVHVIWVTDNPRKVPASCRTMLTMAASQWETQFIRNNRVVPITRLEVVDHPQAEAFARGLAPLVDIGARVLDESDLPRAVTMEQLVAEDILGSDQAVLHRWMASDSIATHWQENQERQDHGLIAVVGQGSDGPAVLDLRSQGPHALVGGTTGSGKSEFLQTWILSLASNYSPDQVTFLLVDYKGGAAFADCVDLPHTVGLVTDLSPHLVRRALTSLRAELRYREELLAAKGAKDLLALELRGDREAPPTLVIVIDEFAALVGDVPEFVDGVIDVAQRGRSLGLHLIMATQRPSGVIKDNLRANTNLRVGLRMSDEADSADVLGTADAAHFSPDTPGRAAARIGSGQLSHFQTAYIGGRRGNHSRKDLEIASLEFGMNSPWSLVPEPTESNPDRAKGPRDIEVLAANIRAAADRAGIRAPRRPWVDQLPEILSFADLGRLVSTEPEDAADASPSQLIIGVVDEPHLQRRSLYRLELAESGNVVFFGGPGSGKTTALLTCAFVAVSQNPNTQLYGIDAGTGRLECLERLPNTGAIVPSAERDRITRLLAAVQKIIDSRIQAAHTEAFAPVLLLVDGVATLKEQYEYMSQGNDPFADLVQITKDGRTVNVHVLFTCERSNGFPVSLASYTPERFCLRMPSEDSYQTLGVPSAILDDAPAGRAVRIGTDEELQIVIPSLSADPEATSEAIDALAQEIDAADIALPVSVPQIPTEIRRDELADFCTPAAVDPAVAFALDTSDLTPVAVPTSGFMLVTGPAGSGRTTALRSLLEALTAAAEPAAQPLDAVLLAPGKSLLEDLPLWSKVASTSGTRTETIDSLLVAMGGAPAASSIFTPLPILDIDPADALPELETNAEVAPFPAPGRRGVVVIEDIGGFDGSGDEQELASLMKLLRRSDVTTIVEGENATVSSVWELAAPLRGTRWALALQPDANDTPSVFTAPFNHARRADFPPGRGLLIHNGVVHGVHVAQPNSEGQQ